LSFFVVLKRDDELEGVIPKTMPEKLAQSKKQLVGEWEVGAQRINVPSSRTQHNNLVMPSLYETRYMTIVESDLNMH